MTIRANAACHHRAQLDAARRGEGLVNSFMVWGVLVSQGVMNCQSGDQGGGGGGGGRIQGRERW
jgi:hypothetical protein